VKNTAESKRSSTQFPALKPAVLVALATLAGCAHSPVAPPHAIAVAHRPSAPAWGEAAKRDLRAVVAGALAPAMALSYDWSCAVVAQDGTLLYSDRSAHAVVPASTQKLIVGAVVLAQFNSGYRFHTRFASALPPRDGVIAGDLWLDGSGDPSLRSDDLRRGVGKLRAAGLGAFDGGVSGGPVITLDPPSPKDRATVTVRFAREVPKHVTIRASMQMGTMSHHSDADLHPTKDPHVWQGTVEFSMGGAWVLTLNYDDKHVEVPLNVSGAM